MNTLTFRVDGMTCDHCVQAVTNEVSGVDGVQSVEVDLESKRVTVVGTAVDTGSVMSAIDEAGYDAELLETA